MFEKEIEEYESVRLEYQQKIADRIGKKQWIAEDSRQDWQEAVDGIQRDSVFCALLCH